MTICILEKFILKIDRDFTSYDVAGDALNLPRGVVELSTTLPEPNRFQYPAVVRGFLVEWPYDVRGQITVSVNCTCVADRVDVGRMFDPVLSVKGGASLTIETTLSSWGKRHRDATATINIYLLGMELPIYG